MGDPASGPRTRHTRRWVIAVVLVALACGVGWRLWPTPPQPQQEKTPPAEPDTDEPITVSNPGYLGPAACAECHLTRTAEFQKTRHYRACWSPERGPMPPGFAPERTMPAPREPDVRFQFSRAGNDLLQTVIRDGPRGPERYPLRVDLIYGAGGGADEVYFTWNHDRIDELPMAWLYPSREWGEQRANSGPSDLTRTATTRCLECHNTWLGHVPGTENEYRHEGAVLGVTCENCHGPGREHVAFHRSHPGEKVGRAVVQPSQLSRDRQMDLCAQCHSNALYARGPAFSYRPGQPLDAHFRTLTKTSRENDHVANQIGYLRQSKCYQKSDAMTCLTCHDPHRPSAPASVAAACARCHERASCSEQKRLPEGAGTDCVGCHMPRYTRVAVNFYTANDRFVFPVRPHEHRIGVYPLARHEVLLTWYQSQPDAASKQKAEQLAGELGDKWQAEGDRLRREYRFVEAIGAAREVTRFKPGATSQERLREAIALRAGLENAFLKAERLVASRQFPDATRELEGILKVKPDWAEVHGKLGTLSAAAGDRAKAVEYLKAVAKYDPDNGYGYNMLGWLAYLDGKGQEAADYFRQADEVRPFTAEINYRWGLSLLLLERWPEAATRFRQGLAVDPNHAGCCQGLSHALRHQGQTDEAIRFARRAARLTQFQNPDVLTTLIDAYAAANRLDEALDTADKAIRAAETVAPGLVPQLQRQRDDLQKRKGG